MWEALSVPGGVASSRKIKDGAYHRLLQRGSQRSLPAGSHEQVLMTLGFFRPSTTGRRV